jgi:hypothetical protein
MAGPVYVKIRLWNPGRDCIFGDSSNVLNYLERTINNDDRPRYFEIKWIGTTQAAGPEELGTAADSTKDGTTTPFQITVVSSSANDTNTAAGHVRKVALIGVTVSSIGNFNAGEDPKLTVEVVNMNGTTDVTSTRYYLRLVHAYACDWGTGDSDAAGDITIESPADTDLQTIKTNNNEANGGTLYFAAGDMVYLDRVMMTPGITPIAIGDGCWLTVTPSMFEDENYDDDELAAFEYQHTQPSLPTYIRDAWLTPLRATNKSTLLFAEQLVVNAMTYVIHIGVRLFNRPKPLPDFNVQPRQ